MQSGVIVKIQNKGLITLPKAYREELGLKEGGLARIRKKSGGLIIEPVRILPYPVRNYSKKELEEFLKLDEKETKKLKKKDLL